MRRALISAVLAMALAAHTAEGAKAEDAERLVVVEMFTSQACSACPPADKQLGKLAERDGILALSYSIDYWNYLEWEDTLADADFSARQRAYAKRRGDRKVYTPQAVVNGSVHAVGSDVKALEKALASAAHPSVALSVTRNEDASLAVEVGPAPDGMENAEATLWLVVYADSWTINVRAGENKGRLLTYHNVVRRLDPVGTWRGEKLHMTIDAADYVGKRCAILLQEGDETSPGVIFAAAQP